MGLGLGAEIVVGYGSIGEFIPPAVRGRWSAYLSLITNSALFFSTFLGYLIIPAIGWRAMFALVGVGAMGLGTAQEDARVAALARIERTLDEAEATSRHRGETAREHALPPSSNPRRIATRRRRLRASFSPPLLRRTLLAIFVQIAVNTVIYGFVVWVPTFLMKQGLGMASSLGYTALMSLGGPAGALWAC